MKTETSYFSICEPCWWDYTSPGTSCCHSPHYLMVRVLKHTLEQHCGIWIWPEVCVCFVFLWCSGWWNFLRAEPLLSLPNNLCLSSSLLFFFPSPKESYGQNRGVAHISLWSFSWIFPLFWSVEFVLCAHKTASQWITWCMCGVNRQGVCIGELLQKPNTNSVHFRGGDKWYGFRFFTSLSKM